MRCFVASNGVVVLDLGETWIEHCPLRLMVDGAHFEMPSERYDAVTVWDLARAAFEAASGSCAPTKDPLTFERVLSLTFKNVHMTNAATPSTSVSVDLTSRRGRIGR